MKVAVLGIFWAAFFVMRPVDAMVEKYSKDDSEEADYQSLCKELYGVNTELKKILLALPILYTKSAAAGKDSGRVFHDIRDLENRKNILLKQRESLKRKLEKLRRTVVFDTISLYSVPQYVVVEPATRAPACVFAVKNESRTAQSSCCVVL